MLKQQHRFFTSVLVVADAAIIVAAGTLAYEARFKLLGHVGTAPGGSLSYGTHAIPVLVLGPLMLLAIAWAGLYQPRRDQRFYLEGWAICKAMLIGLGLSIACVTLLRNILFDSHEYSGLQFLLFGGIAGSLLMVWRFAFRWTLRRLRAHGLNLRHVAIVGTGRLGQVVCNTLTRNSWTGIKPKFFVAHHDTTRQKECGGLPVLGGIGELEDILDSEANSITGVVIALPGHMAAVTPELMMRLERYPIDVRIVPDMNPKYMPMNMSVNELDGMPVLSVRQSPMAGWGGVSKRALDFFGALLALAIFAIPMLVLTVLVRLSGSGPIMFRQERMSINGQKFSIFKFRTMTHIDAEKQALRDAGKGTDAWTKDDDPRITKIGRFMRRTSLDELPQLFNVLLGEMSLVGPRPERPELIEQFKYDWRGYMLRQKVKAGITGWAQINGLRGDTSLKKRLQYDLFYIRNWSLLFDVRILWLTIFRGFVHPNAR